MSSAVSGSRGAGSLGQAAAKIPVPKEIQRTFKSLSQGHKESVLDAARSAASGAIQTVQLPSTASDPQQLGQQIAQDILAVHKSTSGQTVIDLFCSVIQSVISGKVSEADIPAVEIAACAAIVAAVVANPAEQAVLMILIPDIIAVLNWLIITCADKIHAAIAALEDKCCPSWKGKCCF